jgi:hypothetical protein
MRDVVMTPAGARFVDELPAPDDGRGVYLDMLRVAERDLTGDALEARTEEIMAMARAGGWSLSDNFQVPPPEQQLYEQFNPSGKLASTAGTDGLPSILPAAQVSFWADVTRDATVDPSIPAELLADVKTWLGTAASPAQAQELLTMAERSAPIARALGAYAAVGKRYTDQRPR